MLASSHLFRDNLALCERSLPDASAVPRPYIPALHPQRFPVPPSRPTSGPANSELKSPHDRPEDAPDARRGSNYSYYPPVSTPEDEGLLAPASAPPADMANHLQQYPYDDYVSRAPSATPYPDHTADRRVSTSSAGSYDHPYSYNTYRPPFQPARTTTPMMRHNTLPYDYPVEAPGWGRRPSAEQSPAPPARYDEYPHEEPIQGLSYPPPLQLEHQSPMPSLSSSSNSTGLPASPDIALQPSGLVASVPEGAQPPSGTNPGQRTYAFVSLAGSTIRKRPRRRYDEIERLYSCSFEDCTKAYGTLNHLNAHVTMQKHGAKRNPSEFKELRKLWRNQKKAEQMANRPRRRRGVGADDEPHGLHRTASGSYSSPGAGYSDDSEEGTPQPVEGQQHYGQVDQMWPQGDMMHYGVPAMPDEGVMERIPANATLLQSLPSTHPSQQQSYPPVHPQMGYPPPNILTRRASDHDQYDYHRASGYPR